MLKYRPPFTFLPIFIMAIWQLYNKYSVIACFLKYNLKHQNTRRRKNKKTTHHPLPFTLPKQNKLDTKEKKAFSIISSLLIWIHTFQLRTECLLWAKKSAFCIVLPKYPISHYTTIRSF